MSNYMSRNILLMLGNSTELRSHNVLPSGNDHPFPKSANDFPYQE